MQAETSDLVIDVALSDYATMTEKDLDPVRLRLLTLSSERKLSLSALSSDLGKNRSYLENFIRKGSPQELDMKLAIRLAELLDVAPVELGVVGITVDNTQQKVAPPNEGRVTSERDRRPTGTKTLPILGYVRAGEVGFFLDQGTVRGYAMRPESLAGNTEAYAVRVHDESMSNRFEPGWILQVDPWRPVKPGDNVIIELHDGQAFVKVLKRRTNKIVLCEQFNPRKEIEFKSGDVKNVHLVVGVDLIDR